MDVRLGNMEKKFVELSKLHENKIYMQINDIYNKINEITTGFNKIYEELRVDINNKARKNDLQFHILK
jgi:hypothetical protein